MSIDLSFFQEYVGNEGDFFVFLNNRAAPKHHIIEIDMTDKKPGRHFDVIVPVSDVYVIKTKVKCIRSY